ncbi:Ak7-A-prov protein [Thecamonas trahens ATCC 50062]|uniref:Ak7-A-prov protein n=1 Tax=Thecamonas trahens ATCC 50062 TaxID=461836 RepID=A0A0L0D2B9_THETB|nr:Ak7-A-prov protein [Thecamonas trahens ATCC 50062]KNC46437.1 Ak7-A-prov protein [Thecamonas trahens ATCC 50062]|eukprot:XP_013760728.1 Ak7-A-prov protein [Thecamonas trahens ATCC 50062]
MAMAGENKTDEAGRSDSNNNNGTAATTAATTAAANNNDNDGVVTAENDAGDAGSQLGSAATESVAAVVVKQPVMPPRVFVTELDSYIGHHVASALTGIMYARDPRPGALPLDDSMSEYDEPQGRGRRQQNSALAGGADGSGSPAGSAGAGDNDGYEGSEAEYGSEAGAPSFDEATLPAKVEIIGTVRSEASPSFPLPRPAVLPGGELPGAGVPEGVSRVLPSTITRDALLEEVRQCDVIVYDLVSNVNEAKWLVETLADEAESWERPKMFVALSSVLTWGKTGRSDEGDGDEMAFIEEDYKRRKAHPNHKELLYVEKLTTKWSKKKANFNAVIINRGLVYGGGEGVFHYLFKMAWHGSPRQLPVIGRGRNALPAIHVLDLAQVVAQVVALKPDIPYVLAVDDGRMSAMDLVSTISEALGSGAIKRVKRDDPVLVRELTPLQFDMLHLDVVLEPSFIRELEDFVWHAETGLLEAIFDVIREFKTVRELTPLMFYIQGPPGVGKSYYAARIAREYKVHHIQTEDVISDYLAKLTTSQDPADADMLDEIREARAESENGRIPDDLLVAMFREKLFSMPCQNQGFVLDGFPKTLAQAEELFAAGDDDESTSVADDNLDGVAKDILPTNVVILEADDEFIKARMRALPEAQVTGTHWTEDGVARRLAWFREANTDEENAWDFFDSREILPLYITINETTEPSDVLAAVKKLAGKPHNYGPTKKELAARAAAKAEAAAAAAAAAAEEAQRQAAATAAAEAKRDAEWTARNEVIRAEEQKVLELQSQPLREFLMTHVMPTLTEGLIEVCKARPDDPVDYLAEFLFNQDSRAVIDSDPHDG